MTCRALPSIDMLRLPFEHDGASPMYEDTELEFIDWDTEDQEEHDAAREIINRIL